ncbi:MAG: hypothetical protein ACRCST_00700 [Turicibacter sp.]
MKNYLLILLFLTGCYKSKSIDLTYYGPQIGKCYAFNDEAIKVIAVSEGSYFYKHSWNSQDKIFNNIIEVFRGQEIPCDKSGYEFELLLFRMRQAENTLKYLDDLTQPLRKKWYKTKLPAES